MDNKLTSKKTGLGRGIHSLLGDLDDSIKTSKKADITSASFEVQNQLQQISVDLIETNPSQPRKFFDEAKIQELSKSIRIDGILQPLILSPSEEDPGTYSLIAGERRLRAAKLAGFKTVPAIVKSIKSQDAFRIALIENIQRADLNIIEEAKAYDSLIKDYGLTQEQCAEKVGKDRTSVTNALRILNLPNEIQDDIIENRLTFGHARSLLSLEDKKLALRARDIVIKKNLNVRQTEQLVKNYKSSSQSPVHKLPKNKADLDHLAESLKTSLRTKVRLSGNGQKGKIEISYFSSSELERLLAVMGHQV